MYDIFNAAGLCVIPLKDGRPVIKWGDFFNTLPTADAVASWRGREYGLLCGKVSGVIGIDIDTDDEGEIAAIYAAAGDSHVRKRGSKGFTAFYRYDGQPSSLWKKGGEVVCEVLSDKRLTTIPPSPHRKTGETYIWLDGAGLIDCGSLPALKGDFAAKMDALYPRPAPLIKIPSYEVDYTQKVDLLQAEAMLAYISADCPRDEWVTIGMALRDEFGDAACNLWHEWSSKGEKYNLRDAQAAWRSFCHDGITIGTLIHKAKECGWQFDCQSNNQEDAGFSVDISYIFAKKNTKPPEPKPIVVHGIVGEIANWITETAIRPQPILSLAAALSFVGMMKGHRVEGGTNLRTNILALALAPTSAGKDYPQRCIGKLAEACGLGAHMMGEPTSGTAILTGLKKADCIGLMPIDEMGRFMANLTLKSTAGHQREITDYMVKLFSNAPYTFYGRQYASEKDNPQMQLVQPHFCCIGSTVPERLQAACTAAEIIDGFLNRWIVFATNERPEKRRGKRASHPPIALVERITRWLEGNPRKRDQYGNPEPVEVRFTPEAWEVFEDFDQKAVKLLDSEPYPINQLYARSAEHVEKVALCLADDGVIGMMDVALAIQIVEQSNESIRSFALGIVDNQHHADVLYLLNIIKKQSGISRNQLTQQTRKLSNRQRTDILNQLVEAEEIRVEKDGKKICFYA